MNVLPKILHKVRSYRSGELQRRRPRLTSISPDPYYVFQKAELPPAEKLPRKRALPRRSGKWAAGVLPIAVLFRPVDTAIMKFGSSTISYDVGTGDLSEAGSPTRNLVAAPDSTLYVCAGQTSGCGLELFKSTDNGVTWQSCGTYDT